MPNVNVFFFRGLSTYGSDDIKWNPFDQGPMHREFSRAFGARGVNLVPVAGMGSGSWEETSRRALEFLKNNSVWRDETQPVHLFGHSAGGIVMRLLLEQGYLKRRNLLSALTLASPHRGAFLARVFAEMPEKHKGSAFLFRLLGYDVRDKRSIFETVTPEIVGKLWRPDLDPYPFRTASVVTSLERHRWCGLLKVAHSIRAMKSFDLPSDGIVERDTQPWGDVIAELDIDHVKQIGIFDDGRSFARQCDVLTDFFKDAQKKA